MNGLRLAMTILLAVTCASAEETEHDPVLAEMGAPLFQRHCASCHGISGMGNGPAAESLKVAPADLTAISQRRGGAFPAGEVARHIDGRFAPAAHGSREMPVWGRKFSAAIPESGLGESIARGNIATLIEYLKSIQRPASGED